MKIFENDNTLSMLYHRALSLTISKDFANAENGKILFEKHQESEQSHRRRELLAVEQQTQKNRIIEAHGESHFRTQVTNKLFSRVDGQAQIELSDTFYLFSDIIDIETAVTDILEILSMRAASVKRITPLVKSLPWLADELVNLVNKPQYRKRADVQVTDPSLALSYIGLDNLKRVIPIFVLKHWLPKSTTPLPLMKRKLWNDSLAIGMATSILAKEQGLDEFTAYIAGMFSNIGYFAVTRSVLTTFNEYHLSDIKTAYQNKDKKLHDILTKIEPPEKILHKNLLRYSANITANLVEMMPFDRIRITEAMFDLANATSFNGMCPIAQLISKAKAYVTFRSLMKEDLIERDQVKSLLASAKLTPNELALFKKQDIDHIKLSFN